MAEPVVGFREVVDVDDRDDPPGPPARDALVNLKLEARPRRPELEPL